MVGGIEDLHVNGRAPKCKIRIRFLDALSTPKDEHKRVVERVESECGHPTLLTFGTNIHLSAITLSYPT
ncbi:hypothetical protein FRX31_002986 [Thalictrum thalictroides]|uniref:Uncharacterized protein n=1 Tax=Thalictrum thalictroides TaxID=46969 RepID=A0A7J6XCG6_THATH|nr:hypothetical protein FRX31_002986 [Thalictrum thalictroides]